MQLQLQQSLAIAVVTGVCYCLGLFKKKLILMFFLKAYQFDIFIWFQNLEKHLYYKLVFIFFWKFHDCTVKSYVSGVLWSYFKLCAHLKCQYTVSKRIFQTSVDLQLYFELVRVTCNAHNRTVFLENGETSTSMHNVGLTSGFSYIKRKLP